MTVEAAMILPLFLTGMLLLLHLMNLTYVHFAVGAALQNTCKEIVSYTYPVSLLAEGENVSSAVPAGEQILTVGYAQSRVQARLSEDSLCQRFILEKGGIYLIRSSFSDDGQVDLIADYAVSLPLLPADSIQIWYTQRAKMHAWTGWQGGNTAEEGDEDEQIVYVTPTGTAYHRDAYCTYLRPSVSAVDAGSLQDERSKDGEKYYACELCDAFAHPEGSVYITAYGNRYHTSRSCRGIYHDVRAIPLSEAGDRHPCSKCGGH